MIIDKEEYIIKSRSDQIINVMILLSILLFFIGMIGSDNYYKNDWNDNKIILLEEMKENINQEIVKKRTLRGNQEKLDKINTLLDYQINLSKNGR